MDFEGGMSALMDLWSAQSLAANEIQLTTESVLEGKQTLRILGSENSAALQRPLALDPGPWQLRFLADASENTQCWAEVRQRYSYTENGETKEFTWKPKCQLPQNSSAPQRVECTLEPLTHAQFGPFRRYYLSPAQVREQHPDRTVVPVVDALSEQQLEQLAAVGPALLLALVGTGTPDLTPTALIRATLAAAAHLEDAAVVAVPLASRGDSTVDHELGAQVARTYAGDANVLALPETDNATYTDDIAAIVEADQPGPERRVDLVRGVHDRRRGAGPLVPVVLEKYVQAFERPANKPPALSPGRDKPAVYGRPQFVHIVQSFDYEGCMHRMVGKLTCTR
ncbi:MAG TPA: hypothetical protein EYP98_05155, partial [Planctomycetes bacterium]|nr:hypothetical protein [Planctomycetota bacterium]